MVFRLAEPVPDEVAISLRYALERGIEAAFELEDVELASESLPDDQRRGRMLFTESAEGGAGVLRRIQADPHALARAARTALQITHFDPQTGEDLGGANPDGERCERACYDCLLSYSNQSEHLLIDRHLIRDLLVQLARSDTQAFVTDKPQAEHVAELLRQCDTDVERQWDQVLQEGDYRLPDEAQRLLMDAECRPDFFYRDRAVAIFIDGPVHERSDKAQQDAEVEQRLLDAGYSFLRFRQGEDWVTQIRQHAELFGEGHA